MNVERRLMSLSQSKEIDKAMKEWVVDGVVVPKGLAFCSCGQEIEKQLYMRNVQNGNMTLACGNCFEIMNGLKEIRQDRSAVPNRALINYAWKNGHLYSKRERKFLLSMRQWWGNVSAAQEGWLNYINRRIIENIPALSEPKSESDDDEYSDESDFYW